MFCYIPSGKTPLGPHSIAQTSLYICKKGPLSTVLYSTVENVEGGISNPSKQLLYLHCAHLQWQIRSILLKTADLWPTLNAGLQLPMQQFCKSDGWCFASMLFIEAYMLRDMLSPLDQPQHRAAAHLAQSLDLLWGLHSKLSHVTSWIDTTAPTKGWQLTHRIECHCWEIIAQVFVWCCISKVEKVRLTFLWWTVVPQLSSRPWKQLLHLMVLISFHPEDRFEVLLCNTWS